eukprot:TRINITY_DN57942_c0_g1_i1.p1 TRINITY_DN57942_c0_g1~~TRINITY_DN57942_c0_g1_i1.p1  ORF type:complete len:768 (-),score=188.30 TRINITY_DN57942_c0_g1_i1:113-2416(-)
MTLDGDPPIRQASRRQSVFAGALAREYTANLTPFHEMGSGIVGDGTATAESFSDIWQDATASATERRRGSVASRPEGLTSGSYLFFQRLAVWRLLTSPIFDAAIGCVIVVNSFTIGIEQSLRLNNRDTSAIDVVEQCFLAIYVTELSLRLFATCGRCLLFDRWSQFDAILVAFGVMDIIVTYALPGVAGLGPFMVFRTGRLLRLARTMRLLRRFKSLWMLIRGLTESTSTILYTLVILAVILYVFSCVSMELITCSPLAVGPDADEEFRDIVDRHFSSLPQTMLTLLQFVCLDSVGQIYKPLIEKENFLAIYFVGLILIVPIVLMNLVTAVVVNSAFDQAAKDQEANQLYEEQERKRLVKDLTRMFRRLDDDDSGLISRDEFGGVDEGDMQVLLELTQMKDAEEIFNLLDTDGTGEIDIEEFCEGLWRIVVSKVPVETRRMQKQIDEIHWQLKESSAMQAILEETTAKIIKTQRAMMTAMQRGKSIPAMRLSLPPREEQAKEMNGMQEEKLRSKLNEAHEVFQAADSFMSFDGAGQSSSFTFANMPSEGREVEGSRASDDMSAKVKAGGGAAPIATKDMDPMFEDAKRDLLVENKQLLDQLVCTSTSLLELLRRRQATEFTVAAGESLLAHGDAIRSGEKVPCGEENEDDEEPFLLKVPEPAAHTPSPFVLQAVLKLDQDAHALGALARRVPPSHGGDTLLLHEVLHEAALAGAGRPAELLLHVTDQDLGPNRSSTDGPTLTTPHQTPKSSPRACSEDPEGEHLECV